MVSFQTILIILAICLILLSLLISYQSEKEFFENTGTEQPILDENPENLDQIELMNNNNEKYIVINDKLVKGERLQGAHDIDNINITFDEFGRPIGQIMSVEKSKQVCDILGDKCAGFIIQSDDKSDKSIATFFVSKVESGFEQPSAEDTQVLPINDENSLPKYQKFTSYIKKENEKIVLNQ
jgi:hypothetical protein